MNIYIVHEEAFPVGMAATNRILALSKGFVENQARVKIICMRSAERPDRGIVNKEWKGVVNGAEYEYASGTTIRANTFLKRRLQRLYAFLRIIAIIKNHSGRKRNDILLIYDFYSTLFVLYFYALTRLFGLLFVRDLSENPLAFKNRSLLWNLNLEIYFRYLHTMLDAVLVMSENLESILRSRGRKKLRIIRVPMTVETTRFLEKTGPSPDHSRYIAYCGHVGGNKDGVSNLIESFALLAGKIDDIKLYIIGDAPGTNDLEKLKELAAVLGISHRVVFTGRVLFSEIPRYLCNASMLALARPSSIQATAGFPSKLGEYLATGNPVVVTRVGDIPLFLEDGVNAFIVAPDDNEEFSGKMGYVLMHPDVARLVGERGRKVALEKFDYKHQGKRILDFFEDIASA